MIKLCENCIYSIVPTTLTVGNLTFNQDEKLLVLKINGYLVTFKRLLTNEILTLEKMALEFTCIKVGDC